MPGFRKAGEIPTDYELATGNERMELLSNLAGEDPWPDFHPLHLSTKPTAKNPFKITGVDPVRYIGCTGFPADTHEPVWLTVRPGVLERCPHVRLFS